MLQSFTTYYGHMIAGFEFAALETAYFSSRPGKPANMVFVGVGPVSYTHLTLPTT